MVNDKWSEQKEEHSQLANKNEYTCGNRISRIYSENPRKVHMDQSREL